MQAEEAGHEMIDGRPGGGNQSAAIDLNVLHTTYTFSSGLLTKITDAYAGVTTFTYSSSKLQSIKDLNRGMKLSTCCGAKCRWNSGPNSPDTDGRQ